MSLPDCPWRCNPGKVCTYENAVMACFKTCEHYLNLPWGEGEERDAPGCPEWWV